MDQELHVRVQFEDESYWATVDEFPGVFAAGKSLDELRASLAEGIALMLAGDSGSIPEVTLVEVGAPEPLHTTATVALVCA